MMHAAGTSSLQAYRCPSRHNFHPIQRCNNSSRSSRTQRTCVASYMEDAFQAEVLSVDTCVCLLWHVWLDCGQGHLEGFAKSSCAQLTSHECPFRSTFLQMKSLTRMSGSSSRMKAEEAAATMRLILQLLCADFESLQLARSLPKLVISNSIVCFQLRRRKQFEDHQDYLKRKVRQTHQNRKMYAELCLGLQLMHAAVCYDTC